MLKDITINLNVLESMIYFWEASKEGEKIGEAYLMTIADHPMMQLTYDEEFNAESVRRALSAITNREIFSGNKTERKFWNNNMWMMDDFDIMRAMVKPVKTLNLSEIVAELADKDLPYSDVEIVILPMHNVSYQIAENKLLMNFFKIQLDFMDFDLVQFEGQSIKDFVKEAISQM